jgi:7,8-dihydropterin-6-yl-methyl-4-(beta-D-ribofuranosyl)aminobenzene 5'-phosphate synthase
MSKIKNFGAIEQVSICVLVDNKADLIVESDEIVEYFDEEPLLAEHGFSAIIRFEETDLSILWDAGVSRTALMENLRRMEIDPASINVIALSHGHGDHFAALTALLTAMKLHPESREWEGVVSAEEVNHWIEKHRIPLIAHPAAFRERWWVKDDGTMVGPSIPPPKQEWEAAGVEITLSEEPYQLGPGCWTTGYIPRRSFEESGIPTKLLYRQGDSFLKDNLEEDQAMVINVRNKGLVVLSGCAHAGIVNTVNYAREISGIETVWAIIGGFHLAKANDEEIGRTLEHIQAVRPKLIVPCHCTGFKATSQFAAHMPDEFIEGVVGATYKV